MEYELLYKDQVLKINLDHKDGLFNAKYGEEDYFIEAQRIGDNKLSLVIGNRSINAYIYRLDGSRHIWIDGEKYCFSIPGQGDEDTLCSTDGESETKLIITAPMPGSVLQLNVADGDSIEEGQCLAIVEAMKMETGLHASISGKVKKVHVSQGQQVDAGTVLIELEDTQS